MVRARFPWVTVLDVPGNVGFGAGNNLAAEQAVGEYLMLLNPDLTVFPGQMELLLAFADSHPKAGIIGPKLLNPDRSIQRSFYRFPSALIPLYRRTALGRTSWGQKALHHYFMEDANVEESQEVDGFFGSAMLIRRRSFQEIGGFDERFFMYFEDIDLCRRTWEHGWQIQYAPQSMFVHYHQRESEVKHPFDLLRNRLVREHVKSGAKYFWKNRGKGHPRAYS